MLNRKVIVISNVNELSAALRCRVLAPLATVLRGNEGRFSKWFFYSAETTKTIQTLSLSSLPILFFLLLKDCIFFLKNFFLFKGKTDIVIVKNYILPLFGGRIEKIIASQLNPKYIIYDIDDAIYLNSKTKSNRYFRWMRNAKSKVAFWIKEADYVMCSNKFIWADLQGLCPDVLSKPHSLTITFPPNYIYFNCASDIRGCKESLVTKYVWLGSPHTQDNLALWKDWIVFLSCQEDVRVELVGVSEDFDMFEDNDKILKTRWSIDNEKRALRESHFGLNPLVDDIFESRKSAYKVIQYFHAGVIPIVSDVGINMDLIRDVGGYTINDFKSKWRKLSCFDIDLSLLLYTKSKDFSLDATIKNYQNIFDSL